MMFCDVVFMVFFLCSADGLRSVALHEKAEPPALPRGSGLQKVATSGRAGFVGEAVRATGRDEAEERAAKKDLNAGG